MFSVLLGCELEWCNSAFCGDDRAKDRFANQETQIANGGCAVLTGIHHRVELNFIDLTPKVLRIVTSGNPYMFYQWKNLQPGKPHPIVHRITRFAGGVFSNTIGNEKSILMDRKWSSVLGEPPALLGAFDLLVRPDRDDSIQSYT